MYRFLSRIGDPQREHPPPCGASLGTSAVALARKLIEYHLSFNNLILLIKEEGHPLIHNCEYKC